MTERITIAGLAIDRRLHDFVEAGILSGIGLGADAFWGGFAEILRELRPRNAALLAGCDELQVELDAWRRAHPGRSEPQDEQAEPQVVVPVGDAGLVVDAVNARWGSLYAAVYDSDVVPEGATARGGSSNPARGARVVALGRDLLDAAAPLKHGSHAGATGYAVHDGRLMVALAERCRVGLLDADAFVGYRGEPDAPSAVLMRHQGLHIEIVLDRDDPVGAIDRAGVRDLVLESAVTTIVDLEESFATVGAADKVLAYSVLRGLFQDATGPAEQRATPFSRLSPDREYTAPDGSALRLPGRSLVLVRHVGIHMHTDAVLDGYGRAIPAGLLDALVATAAAVPSLRGTERSVYVIRPQQHGSEEADFTIELFRRVESVLGLPERTIKVGVMGEERRADVGADRAAAADRIAFIDTGFLGRSGGEIRSSDLAARP